MGMVNFYRRFIPNAAKIMQPLFVALAGKPKDLQWNDAMVNAFQDSKTALADATMLTHPRRNAMGYPSLSLPTLLEEGLFKLSQWWFQ